MDTGVFYRGSIFVGAIGLVLISLQPCTLLGNPEGGAVVGGQAAISQSGTTLQVLQSSDRAVINWRDFSIQPNETTRFIQPSASSAGHLKFPISTARGSSGQRAGLPDESEWNLCGSRSGD